MLTFSLFFFQNLPFSHFWPLLAFSVVFVVVSSSFFVRLCNFTGASVPVTPIRFTTNMFHNIFFPHDDQSSNHFILPAWFPSIWRLQIFLWAPPIIIPSIIFYMVIYYLDIDRSMLFLSLRSLLTPSWAHCFHKPPPFPCFVLPSIFQNTRLVV